MIVRIEQPDLVRLTRSYIENLGISLTDKDVVVEFIGGRMNKTKGIKNPSYANVSILEKGETVAKVEDTIGQEPIVEKEEKPTPAGVDKNVQLTIDGSEPEMGLDDLDDMIPSMDEIPKSEDAPSIKPAGFVSLFKNNDNL